MENVEQMEMSALNNAIVIAVITNAVSSFNVHIQFLCIFST